MHRLLLLSPDYPPDVQVGALSRTPLLAPKNPQFSQVENGRTNTGAVFAHLEYIYKYSFDA